MVNAIKGDLFTAQDAVFVQCISADFAMGAGIAVEFNKRFNIKNRIIKSIGHSCSMNTKIVSSSDIICLVTKEKYWQKPVLSRMSICLKALNEHCLKHNIKKIAMPAIGCGLDRLKFDDVYFLLCNIMDDSIEVNVYLK